MKILETERLIIRQFTADDAAFMLDLLNQPSFIKYIGDRNVRNVEQSRDFIESRFLTTYRTTDVAFYVVEAKAEQIPIGICGFVERDFLPEPDLGFAFLPQFEKKGYGFESAAAMLEYGREKLNLRRVLAITTQDNGSSIKLLEKLGFAFESLIETPPDGEQVRLFSIGENETVLIRRETAVVPLINW